MNETMMPLKKEKNDVILIKLDRPYELRFSNKALKEYSALTQTSMKNFDESLMDFQKQQAAAYVLIKLDCQRQGLPIPTPELVEDLLDQHVTPGRLFYLLSKAAEAAFADDELLAAAKANQKTAKEEADPPQAAGTGGRA